jgi:hypothetical protein
MDEWSKIAALLVPLALNWWEVRKLRKEVELQRAFHEHELTKVKSDINQRWAEHRALKDLLTVAR